MAAIAGRLQFVGLISNGAHTVAVMGLGVDPEAEARVCPDAVRATSLRLVEELAPVLLDPRVGRDLRVLGAARTEVEARAVDEEARALGGLVVSQHAL